MLTPTIACYSRRTGGERDAEVAGLRVLVVELQAQVADLARWGGALDLVS